MNTQEYSDIVRMKHNAQIELDALDMQARKWLRDRSLYTRHQCVSAWIIGFLCGFAVGSFAALLILAPR